MGGEIALSSRRDGDDLHRHLAVAVNIRSLRRRSAPSFVSLGISAALLSGFRRHRHLAVAVALFERDIERLIMTKSDSDLQQDVLRELSWDSRVEETEVGVEVDRGVVTLTGTVSSWAIRVAAQEAAHRVAGVLDVANDIKVKLPGDSCGQTPRSHRRCGGRSSGMRWFRTSASSRPCRTVG